MRATNPVFADWLLDVGNGLTGPTIDLLANQIRVLSSTRALIQAPIGNALNCRTIDSIKRCVILSPTNRHTEVLNDEIKTYLRDPHLSDTPLYTEVLYDEILNLFEGSSSFRYSVGYPVHLAGRRRLCSRKEDSRSSGKPTAPRLGFPSLLLFEWA